MTRSTIFFALLLSLFGLSNCGRDRAVTKNPATPPPTHSGPTDPGKPTELKKVRVFLFAAGYCEPCKEELPKIRDWFKGLSKEKQEQAQMRVYVIAGESTGEQPTQPYAESFGKKFDLPFEMKADKFARTYHKFYDSGNNVPATVITDDAGNPLKTFAPRKVSPEEIAQAISEVTK